MFRKIQLTLGLMLFTSALPVEAQIMVCQTEAASGSLDQKATGEDRRIVREGICSDAKLQFQSTSQ